MNERKHDETIFVGRYICTLLAGVHPGIKPMSSLLSTHSCFLICQYLTTPHGGYIHWFKQSKILEYNRNDTSKKGYKHYSIILEEMGREWGAPFLISLLYQLTFMKGALTCDFKTLPVQ